MGRPFLAPARAIPDFDKGKIELSAGKDKFEIPIPNLRRIPEYTYEDANRIDHFSEEEIDYDELIGEVFAINDSEEVNFETLSVAENSAELELKPLRETLKHIFLEEGKSNP